MIKNYLKSIVTVVFVSFCLSIHSQNQTHNHNHDRMYGPNGLELTCVMPDTGAPSDLYIAVRESVRQKMESRIAPCANIEVVYTGFPTDIFGGPGPEQEAFQLAMDIWENLIDTPVTIRIDANWEGAPAGSLGGAAATYFQGLPGSTDNVIYPAPLYEKLIGVDANPGGFDIFCTFNSNRNDWFFPTSTSDITPAGQFNFTAVVLHEIGHGLGIAGFGRQVQNGVGQDVGVLRRLPNGGISLNNPAAEFLSPWDTFIDGTNIFGQPVALTDENNFPDPSDVLLAAMEQQTSFLTCNSPAAIAENTSGEELRIEGALNGGFTNGSSYSHWNEDTINGTDFALMTPFLGPGETVYDPGDVTLAFMQDMGWTICDRVLSSDNFIADDFTVSPNPFLETLTIDLPQQLINETLDFSIVDMNGKVILTDSSVNSNEVTISNLKNLTSGLYFLTIESASSDLRITKKIIKN